MHQKSPENDTLTDWPSLILGNNGFLHATSEPQHCHCYHDTRPKCYQLLISDRQVNYFVHFVILSSKNSTSIKGFCKFCYSEKTGQQILFSKIHKTTKKGAKSKIELDLIFCLSRFLSNYWSIEFDTCIFQKILKKPIQLFCTVH